MSFFLNCLDNYVYLTKDKYQYDIYIYKNVYVKYVYNLNTHIFNVSLSFT
jgi:hypothetical protein